MGIIRANGVAGKLSADLSIGGTTMSSAGLADLPAVTSPDYAKIVLFQTDSNGRVTKKEIVYVTAHTASSTSATIAKGKESTSDQAWNGSSSPDSWVHAPTAADFNAIGTTIDTAPATASAQDDEFDDSTGMSGPTNGLNVKWSKHNLGTSTWLKLDSSKAPGCLLFDIPAAQTQSQAVYQTAPSGDFRLTCSMIFASEGDRQMWGPAILDSSGNGIAICLDDPSGDTTTYVRAISAWVAGGTEMNLGTSHNTPWINSTPTYCSLRKSGTTYYGAVWTASKLMATIVTETSKTETFTPAYIAFGRWFGLGGSSTQASQILLDWMRVS